VHLVEPTVGVHDDEARRALETVAELRIGVHAGDSFRARPSRS
jgi:hypothetical protein